MSFCVNSVRTETAVILLYEGQHHLATGFVLSNRKQPRSLNVFRNSVFRGFTGVTVIVATVVSFILPFGDDAFVSEHIFKNLFVEATDLRLDDEFLNSWEAAHLSDADSIGQFIEAFLSSYATDTNVAIPATGIDTHALWTILKGVSINLDPPAVPNHLISTLRTAVQTAAAPGPSLIGQTGMDVQQFVQHSLTPPLVSSGFVASLMSKIQRQGP